MTEPTADEEAIFEAVGRFQYDPQGWALFAWDWGQGHLAGVTGPRDWQRDINILIRDHLSNPATRYQPLQIAVSSGHGIGKSSEIGMIAEWAMSCFDDAKVVATANTDTQLRTKTVPEVGKWFRSAINAHWFDTQVTSIKSRDPLHRDSWRMDFIPWSEHNTEAFAGLHNKDRIIVLLFDESSKIADPVWEVAEGALTDENTIIIWLVFGNPTRNTGRFRECFRRFRHRWTTRQIDSRDVPGTNKTKIAQWATDHGEDSDFFKVRVRGQFPAQSVMQFISEEDADKARRAMAGIKLEMIDFAPVIIGLDPAWTGEDTLEIVLRQGLYSKSLRSIAKNDNDIEIANMLAHLEDEYHADAVFIDAGYGTGIASAGKVLGRNWQIVWFSGKPYDAGYMNKRAEMWGEMKRWLKSGGAIDPKDDALYQDLIGLETVPRLDGKILLESKEDMKERGIPSPNRADALALTFAHPVTKSVGRRARQTKSAVQGTYQPFADLESTVSQSYGGD